MREPRVLIIEDDDVLRVMFFTILRHQPIAVDTASTTEEALERIEACDYALMLIDMDLEGADTARFLREFRQRRPDATTFVIALQTPGISDPADSALVSAVLNKPVEINTLAEVVRECAAVVPPPENPAPCPPAESEIRSKLERDFFTAN